MSHFVNREKQVCDEISCDNHALYVQNFQDLFGVATILEALTHSNHAGTHVLGFCGDFSGVFCHILHVVCTNESWYPPKNGCFGDVGQREF